MVYLYKVKLNKQGYTPQGYYYGQGEQLWEFISDEIEGVFRAPNRDGAKKYVKEYVPNAKFFR